MSVITIRLPKEIKRRLQKRRLNVSETVRNLLERYVAELELQDLADRLETLKERLAGRIDPELLTRLVRQDRETR
jgi:predicted DNA-binding protein